MKHVALALHRQADALEAQVNAVERLSSAVEDIHSEIAAFDYDRFREDIEELSTAIGGIATQIKYLGGGANTDTRGAVEFLGISIKEGFDSLSTAVAGIELEMQLLREQE